MKKVLTVAVFTLLAGLAYPASSLHASPAVSITAGTVKVTVHYAGKGKVDSTHKIWVWLFDNPNIGPGSMPIDQVAIDTNDADAVFEGVAPTQVFIAVAFDEQGVMTGDGPPPTGSPIGILTAANGQPTGVAPGEKGVVKLTFDDSQRMP
jgi:hypothetical protein